MSLIPRATLRVQLHADYTLDDAAAQLDYFAALGISHLYVSPITRARSGSRHGYDTVDYAEINPELGGLAALQRLVTKLRGAGMGLIVDIVPNHMAACHENPWWRDLLSWGRQSHYADYFDIDWGSATPELSGKLLAPYLGGQYGDALTAGQLRLVWGAAGGFEIAYHDARFPLAPQTYPLVWADAGAAPGLAALTQAHATLGDGRDVEPLRSACAQLAQARHDPVLGPLLDAAVAAHDPTRSDGRARLHALLEAQHYRLAWWRSAAEQVNWRRFFEIGDLIALRVDRALVFDAVHALTLDLYAQGLIDGVRVDHIDGITDPADYCRQLRTRLEQAGTRRPPDLPPTPYVVVEKILAAGEQLDTAWAIQGTTGYDFMDEISGVLHQAASQTTLDTLWREHSGDPRPYAVQLAQSRRELLALHFAAEHERLVAALYKVAQLDPATRDWGVPALRRTTLELLVAFPVYRVYAGADGRNAADAALCRQAVATAWRYLQPDDQRLLERVDAWLGGEPPRLAATPASCTARLEAIRCYQQLTAPLAAKALEDTLFFRYGRLLSRNEVGGAPESLAYTGAYFHAAAARRTRDWPHTLLTTATHDHKRGADARLRLAAVSDYARDWADLCASWISHRPEDPHRADQYMLLQSLIAAWPPELVVTDTDGLAELVERVADWQLKALREAEQRSSWFAPNTELEAHCAEFLRRRMLGAEAEQAVAVLSGLLNRIAPAAALKGLTQCLVHATAPGVPDVYQGTEFWDHTLTDPDNRRPVDYAARHRGLAAPADWPTLLHRWRDGRIKQTVLRLALNLRREWPTLFAHGGYRPLALSGAHARDALAYLRSHGDSHALVVVPLRCPGDPPALPMVPPENWEDTAVALPARLTAHPIENVLTGAELCAGPPCLPLAQLLAEAPVGLFRLQAPTPD